MFNNKHLLPGLKNYLLSNPASYNEIYSTVLLNPKPGIVVRKEINKDGTVISILYDVGNEFNFSF